MKKRKSVEEIFSEVRDHEKVVVPWKSLSDALNSRLDSARIGVFAGTSIQHVSSGKTLDREELFLQIVRETELNWRQADFVLGQAEEILEEGEQLDEIKEDERFAGELLDDALEIIKSTDNIYSVREQRKIEGDIAVVEPERMSDLDRAVLPDEFTEVSIFMQGELEEPRMHIFSSTGEIASAVSRSIDPEYQNEIAVVAERGSRYWRLTANMLESRGIKVQRGEQLGNLERKFLNLCEIASTEGRIRSRDIRTIARRLKLGLEGTYLSSEETADLKEFLNVSDYLTFGELLEGFQEIYQKSPRIRNVLEGASLIDSEVTRDSASMLEQLLRKDSDEGVKMVKPEDAVVIDRNQVFFLGVDADWIDEAGLGTDKFDQKDFISMIQNGEDRYFMVQEFTGGKKITPSLHLKQVFGKSGYRDFLHEDHTLERSDHGHERREFKEWKTIETVSQSDLNTFGQSPRAYYFRQLVSDKKEKRQVRGQLIHDYAEYAFSNEGLEDNDRYVELMMDEIESFIEEREKESIRTEFRIGVQAINELKENLEVEEFEHDLATGDNGENLFSQHFEGGADSSSTEAYFRNEEIGAKGKIDLIVNMDHLLDIKTSQNPRKPKDIVKKALPSIETRKPDFQPLMYILDSVERFGDREIKFSYFFTHGAMREDLREKESFDEKLVTVRYRPWSFKEELQGNDVFEHLIRGVSQDNDRRKTLEKLTLPEFRKFFSEIDVDFREKEKIEEELLPEFERFVKKRVGDYRYVEKGTRSAIRKIIDYRLSGFYKEDIEDFRKYLEKSIEDINSFRKEGFPAGDISGDEPFREMIIDGTER